MGGFGTIVEYCLLLVAIHFASWSGEVSIKLDVWNKNSLQKNRVEGRTQSELHKQKYTKGNSYRWISLFAVVDWYLFDTMVLKRKKTGILWIKNTSKKENTCVNIIFKRTKFLWTKRVGVIQRLSETQYLCGLQANLLSVWQQNDNSILISVWWRWGLYSS